MPDIFKCPELSASECQGRAAITYWQQGQSFIRQMFQSTLDVLKLNVRVGAFSERPLLSDNGLKLYHLFAEWAWSPTSSIPPGHF